jgi:hypothetical protein
MAGIMSSPGLMGKGNKKKLPPSWAKRMNRVERLQVTVRRLNEYDGSDVVGSCRRRYGVDWLCAIKELQLQGLEINPEYVSQLRRTEQEQAKKNREKQLERHAPAVERSERYPFSEGD